MQHALVQPRSQGPFSTSSSRERTLGTRLALVTELVERRSRPLLLRIPTAHANSHGTSCIERAR